MPICFDNCSAGRFGEKQFQLSEEISNSLFFINLVSSAIPTIKDLLRKKRSSLYRCGYCGCCYCDPHKEKFGVFELKDGKTVFKLLN